MNFLKGEAVACQRKVYLNAICCAGSAAFLGREFGYQNLLEDVCNLCHLEVMMRAFKRSARFPGFLYLVV